MENPRKATEKAKETTGTPWESLSKTKGKPKENQRKTYHMMIYIYIYMHSFSIACYIEYVWNVYEVGMANALILLELCQDSLGETMESFKDHQKST